MERSTDSQNQPFITAEPEAELEEVEVEVAELELAALDVAEAEVAEVDVGEVEVPEVEEANVAVAEVEATERAAELEISPIGVFGHDDAGESSSPHEIDFMAPPPNVLDTVEHRRAAVFSSDVDMGGPLIHLPANSSVAVVKVGLVTMTTQGGSKLVRVSWVCSPESIEVLEFIVAGHVARTSGIKTIHAPLQWCGGDEASPVTLVIDKKVAVKKASADEAFQSPWKSCKVTIIFPLAPHFSLKDNLTEANFRKPEVYAIAHRMGTLVM